jgi:AcrR family transcriptional regulator
MSIKEQTSASIDDKKQKFVTAAHALFLTKGYAKTSVNDIITHAGVSKGAFYHHFSSKSELLDAFVEVMFQEFQQLSATAPNKDTRSAIVQWNEFMLSANQWKVQYKDQLLELMMVLHAEENLPLNQRLTKKSLELVTPQFKQLIQLGMDQGIFDVEDADSCAHVLTGIFVSFSDTFYEAVVSEDDSEIKIEFITRRINAINYSMERILGAPANSLQIADTKTIAQWLS